MRSSAATTALLRQRLMAISIVMLLAACSRNPQKRGGDLSMEPLRVAAAADLARAFPEIGAAFERSAGRRVVFSFGSSGLLAKQLAQGAPFDVFASADVSYVDNVVAEGVCLGETRALYAQGRLAIWSKDASLGSLRLEALATPRIAKMAIANPEHAPYGRAAREAMMHAGVWREFEPKVVFAENVQQALSFAQSGNADVAIVALSLAMNAGGAHTPIETSLHAPLDQAIVACARAKAAPSPEARAFVRFVSSDEGRAILRRYGFTLSREDAGAL